MKKFFIKDESGRGYHSTVTLDELIDIYEDDEDYDGYGGEFDESLTEWAENAEIGDTWEDSPNAEIFTRIE